MYMIFIILFNLYNRYGIWIVHICNLRFCCKLVNCHRSMQSGIDEPWHSWCQKWDRFVWSNWLIDVCVVFVCCANLWPRCWRCDIRIVVSCAWSNWSRSPVWRIEPNQVRYVCRSSSRRAAGQVALWNGWVCLVLATLVVFGLIDHPSFTWVPV